MKQVRTEGPPFLALACAACTWCLLHDTDVKHILVCKGDNLVIMLKILDATVQN